ncbi:carboxymuconolactone decarboxylase family protein [Candidatus Woesearchaeota archaeon]|nr:carboxymuconolactone decarboxylase family protein [Candidatus Woesearchaeota archaeon]RLE42986.1 MAG: carboxymuconolactone decarboxylase family protein [Candidatus Woesearchaeota archaeon]
MGEYKELLKQIHNSLKKFSQETPAQTEGFMDLMKGVEKRGELSEKQKELIAVACAVISQCKWCIAFHVDAALKAGATRGEVLESAWMAVLMGGGPALMYAQCVLEALDEFGA